MNRPRDWDASSDDRSGRSGSWHESSHPPEEPRSTQACCVHLECLDSRSARWRQADDACAIITPAKMGVPCVSTRMEERHEPPGRRIGGLRTSSLGHVAVRTGVTQVRFACHSVATSRNDVVDVEGLPDCPLGCSAILALPPRTSGHGCGQLAGHRHGHPGRFRRLDRCDRRGCRAASRTRRMIGRPAESKTSGRAARASACALATIRRSSFAPRRCSSTRSGRVS